MGTDAYRSRAPGRRAGQRKDWLDRHCYRRWTSLPILRRPIRETEAPDRDLNPNHPDQTTQVGRTQRSPSVEWPWPRAYMGAIFRFAYRLPYPFAGGGSVDPIRANTARRIAPGSDGHASITQHRSGCPRQVHAVVHVAGEDAGSACPIGVTTADRPAVNRFVVGSSPTRGALPNHLSRRQPYATPFLASA